MKTKKVCSSELAYVLGILFLALGTALMEKARFGVSMVVAPSYLLHLKISQTYPAYTFGTSGYIFQAFLLVLLAVIIGRFKISSLFSFVTAVIFGYVLDFMIMLLAKLSSEGFVLRTFYYVSGILVCAVGISFLFHTYITPEAYELFVKEISEHFGKNINSVKTVYDICSCCFSIILSFIFFGFGHFEGVKLGTILCALVNGRLIAMVSSFLESRYEFRDSLPYRKLFEK